MPILQIEGVGEVEIDQGFTRLTPEQQNATVDEIVASIRGGPAPAPTGPSPSDQLLPAGAQPAAPAAPAPEPGLTAAAGRVASRAGQVASERFGDRPLGASEETIKDLRARGILTPEGQSPTPIHLLNEVLVRFGAPAADAVLRSIGAGVGAVAGAAGQVAQETGLADQGMARRLERDVGTGIEVAGLVAGQPAAGTQAAAARSVGQAQRATAGEAAAARVASPGAAAATSEEFKTISRSFYKKSEDAGVVIKPASMKALAEDTFSSAANTGLDEVLTKNALAAVNRLEKLADPKTGAVSFEILDRARQVAGDAATKAIIEAKGKTTNDVRIAELVINKIDDFVDGLKAKDLVFGDAKVAAESIAEARKLWSTAAKLDTIDRLVRIATESASQFRGSGFENALVTQFRQLAKNDAAMKRFSADEQAGIRLVNRGTTAAQISRGIGSLAARGPVSALSGAGVGGSIGSALLGPGIGTVAGAGAQFAIGEVGRKIATVLARRAVAQLEETIRSGGNSPFARATLARANASLAQLTGATAPATAGQSQRQ